MKKVALTGCLAILCVILVLGTLSAQPAEPGRGGGGYCPWMGGGGYQQGQQRGWYCPWMGYQSGAPVAKPGQPLSADQAKALVEQHIGGNPNLKAGKVAEKDGNYEVDIVTKDGSLVDKIQVNKQTGWFRSVY